LNSNIHTQIKEKIENTLQIEGKALLDMSLNVSDEICQAVEVIFKSNGRLIVTGIGKSAIVGQKIVATLNSTGTSAVFMHAADAIHGDLGMIRQDDIVLCISKSGDTAEIKVLVPLIKGFGNTLIAMVSNGLSYLASNTDYKILIPVDAEADPNNLAPTTSTTLQMAMGDALAIALLSLRGFSQEHFAKFHPGGSLGKQLYLKVSDLLSLHEKPKVYINDNIRKVIMEISSKRLGATAVLDDNENLVGVVTDGDLRRMLETVDNVGHLKAGDIMNSNPKTIQKSNLAIEALTVLRKFSISQLVVKDDNRYVGMIHIHDMIKEGLV